MDALEPSNKRPCGIDPECTARKLLATHGKDAVMVARLWASNALQAGEGERYAAWFEIMEICQKNLNGHATPCGRAVSKAAPAIKFPNET